jgi:membrane protease subunit (stomatin/prohibitin family)
VTVSFGDFVRGELIDIIEWHEESADAMVWRFDRPNDEIKNGAQLIVRPGQVAVFVDQGKVADVFQGGRHELSTENLPVLSRLRGWAYGFHSPFKADIVFVSTRQFPSHKWGTKTPVMTKDPQLGPVRLRAYGTYIVRVGDAKVFVTQLVGSNPTFEIDQIADQIRDLVVSRFSELLGEKSIPVLELASQYRELGDLAATNLAPDLAKLGLALTQLVVESIALPDEVAATLDQRTRIGLIGDIGAYAALQSADAIRDSARNPGAGGAGAAIGVGIAMAGKIGDVAAAALRPGTPPATPPAAAAPSGPPPIPTTPAFYVAVNGQQTGPFHLDVLRQRVADGSLTSDTLVWRDGMSQWAPASDVPEVARLFAGKPKAG